MTIDEVFDEYPVMYVLAQALDLAREAAVEEYGDVTDRERGHDETNNFYYLVNEKVVNDTMNRLQDKLCDPAWSIIRENDDFDEIRTEMAASDTWADDAAHAIRLVCLYGACLRMNQKMMEAAEFSAHQLLNARAKEATKIAEGEHYLQQ